MAQGAEIVEEYESAAWNVDDFLGELRSHGFDLGVDQYLTIQRLVVTLAARGEMPEHPRAVGGLLAPIVCRSPAEQRSFHLLYREWLGELPMQTGEDGDASKEEHVTDLRRRQRDIRRYIPRLSRGSYWIAALIALACIAGAAYFVVRRGSTHPPPSPQVFVLSGTVKNEKGVPQPNAEVKAVENANAINVRLFNSPVREISTKTGADGTYSLSLAGLTFPLTVTAEFGGCRDSAPFDDSSKVTPTVLSLKCSGSDNPGLWQFIAGVASDLWQIMTKAAPGLLLLAVALLLLLVARRRLYLKKWRTADELHTMNIIVERARERLRQMLSLRRAVQSLRRQRPTEPKELDVAQTVEATVKTRLFIPIYRNKKSAPEYLILINRSSPQDHLSRMEDEAVRHLVKNGIFVDRYYFNEDPRLCWQPRQRARGYTLSELAAYHPNHRLVIFDDGSAFFDPLTGGPRGWLSQFYNWQARAILTPDFRTNRYREERLSDLGFLVLPATGGGIVALGEVLGRDARHELSVDDDDYALPPLLHTRATRWLEDYAPAPEVLKEMCAQLKGYLGDEGYYWLGACAVYPALNWDLTLYLGYALLDDRKVNDLLPRLLRLPWFQHGNMPNWVRDALLSDMTPEPEVKVRRTLEKLLLRGGESPRPDRFSLTVARKRRATEGNLLKSPLHDIRRAAGAWGGRLFQRDNVLPEQTDSLVKDYVFMSFMLGIRRNRLSFLVPRELEAILIPKLGTDFVALISRYPALVVLAGTFVLNLMAANNIGDLIPGTIVIAVFTSLYVLGERDIAKAEQVGEAAGRSVSSERRRSSGLRKASAGYLKADGIREVTKGSLESGDNQAYETRKVAPRRNKLFEYVSLFWYTEDSWSKWFRLPFIAVSVAMFVGAAVMVILTIFVLILMTASIASELLR
jgi:hypothetical protein